MRSKLSKMTYAFTTSTAADLVDTAEEWPGIAMCQAARSAGHVRPKHFFRDDGDMPDVVSLPIARSRGFEDVGLSAWAGHVTTHRRAPAKRSGLSRDFWQAAWAPIGRWDLPICSRSDCRACGLGG